MENEKDREIDALRAELEALRKIVARHDTHTMPYYSSVNHGISPKAGTHALPAFGFPPSHCTEFIKQAHELDFKPRLNTSSYVNVVTEPEERDMALLGLETNIADAAIYPASIKIHDYVVDGICQLWNAPSPAETGEEGYSGAGTVGSTEACLLAGLAHKFRWRKWYAARHGMTDEEIIGVKPNLIISTCFQACWEKLFRFFDITPRFITPTLANRFAIDAADIAALCDDKTIAVVGILGNHYNGMYDPIWDMDEAISKINAENGYQIGIHVDAASGGFIAPFQEGMPPFDFRLANVLSISASGHKFGESVCGTGWIAFRRSKDLAEHVSTTVTYLGGRSQSMTLNFSRPATGPYVQLYKFLRLGRQGYTQKVANQMAVASVIRRAVADMKHPDGEPRFEIIDGGDQHCLPVVSARLNPNVATAYNDIDIQHALSESHWYVSGYRVSLNNPITEKLQNLCKDCSTDETMFRVVCKSNLTRALADDLIEHIEETMAVLDDMEAGYTSVQHQHAKNNWKKLMTKAGHSMHSNDFGHGHTAC